MWALFGYVLLAFSCVLPPNESALIRKIPSLAPVVHRAHNGTLFYFISRFSTSANWRLCRFADFGSVHVLTRPPNPVHTAFSKGGNIFKMEHKFFDDSHAAV